MSLRPIYGHRSLLDRLDGALASGRFPQAVLLTGLPGVGKQRLALRVAQGLLCSSGPGTPCGSCGPCRQVDKLGHPDLHWFVPIPRPKAGDPDKQLEEAQESLAGVFEDRRRTGLWTRPEGMVSHSLASVRLLQRRVWVTPFSADRKVFVLGDAERLVVQEASQEAANALLKILEEPPADTTLLLTTADPHALLPTIRSRLVTIRVGRISDEDVRAFLQREVDPPLEEAVLERRTVLAEGRVGQALAPEDAASSPDTAADDLLAAVGKRDGSWVPLALGQPPWSARGDFTGMLDALAFKLRARLAATSSGASGDVAAVLEALRQVEETRAAAQGNVNPQLALAVLARDLEHVL